MSYLNSFEKEGEFIFHLKSENRRIYSLVTNVNEKFVFISNIQGHKNIDLIKNFTKQCFGMRPHNLLLYCVIEFYRNIFNIEKLCGIKKECHIYNELNKKERIKFDYDHFFREIFKDKLTEKKCWYIMPNIYPLKPISDIKKKKRSMYKKRYQMLNDISEKFKEFKCLKNV
jgi:uncharacterized protein VirK/YbjX